MIILIKIIVIKIIIIHIKMWLIINNNNTLFQNKFP